MLAQILIGLAAVLLIAAPTTKKHAPKLKFERSYRLGASFVLKTQAGGVLVVGGQTKKKQADGMLMLLKLSPRVRSAWRRTYGGQKNDTAYAAAQTKDGGFIVVGTTESKGSGKKDIWIFKVNPSGNVLWEKTFGGKQNDTGTTILAMSNGNYLVVGDTKSKGLGLSTTWILSVTGTGKLLWDKTTVSKGEDSAVAACQTKNNRTLIIVGRYSPPGLKSPSSNLILAYNPHGKKLWRKALTSMSHGLFTDVVCTRDGGFVVVGSTEKNKYNKSDGWVLKFDQAGNLKWEKTFGWARPDEFSSVVELHDGKLLISGTSKSYDETRGRDNGWLRDDGWLLKLDSNGKAIWQKVYGEKFTQRGLMRTIQIRPGHYVAVGWIEMATKTRMWLLGILE